MTTMPKSLHTVTALVNVAVMLRAVSSCSDARSLVTRAAGALGYADAPDTYALKEQAVAKLARMLLTE